MLSVGLAYTSFAENADYQKQKNKIESEIRMQNKILSTTEQKYSSEQKKILIMEKQISTSIYEIEKYKINKLVLERSVEELQLEIAKNDANLNYHRERLKKIIVLRWGLLSRGISSNAIIYSSSNSPSQYNLQSGTLAYLAKQEASSIEQVKMIRTRQNLLHEKQLASLGGIKKNEQNYADKYNQTRSSLSEKLTTVKKLATMINNQKKQIQEKNNDYNRIISIIKKIEQEKRAGFTGSGTNGFSAMRGKLRWPVVGKIIQQGSSAIGVGVEISVDNGSYVSAVYDGKIVFADAFPGFKMLVIIEHGDGYYTLYGYNQSIFKLEGDKVAEGEVIGIIGGSYGLSELSERKTKNIAYFEIRKSSTSENAVAWLRKIR